MDDNKQINFLYKSLFMEEYEITTFDNIGDFMRKISLVLPEVVILDLNFQGKSIGYDIAVKVREISKTVSIIIISSFIDHHIIKKFMSLNIYEFLSKPIDLRRLDAIIHEIANATDAYCELAKRLYTNRLCILEDTNQMRLLYGYQFSEFQLSLCKHFDELKKLQDKHEVNTIILDYKLADNENFDDVLDYTRKYYQNAKIILISGSIMNLRLDQKYRDVIQYFFEKPVDCFDTIKAAIRESNVRTLV